MEDVLWKEKRSFHSYTESKDCKTVCKFGMNRFMEGAVFCRGENIYGLFDDLYTLFAWLIPHSALAYS